jgi:hypothetical protein
MAADDDTTVHVELLAQRLTQQQEDAAATEQHRTMVNSHRVSRVPYHLRVPGHNRDAYTPGLVAIGPLHASRDAAECRLRPGHRLKMAYLNSLISRGHPDASCQGRIQRAGWGGWSPPYPHGGPPKLPLQILVVDEEDEEGEEEGEEEKIRKKGDEEINPPLPCHPGSAPAHHLDVIQGYVRLIAAREREARAMYAAEDVDNICAEDFIQMLVLDGCFILEHLVNVATGRQEPSLHSTPFGPAQLSVDLVLAENQIPFFVLVDLIGSTRLPEFESMGYDPPVLLMKLVLYFLGGEKGRDMSESLPPVGGFSHILHLLHTMVAAARTRWEPPPPGPGSRKRLCKALNMVQGFAQLLWLSPLLVVALLLHPTLPEESTWRARYGPLDVPSTSDMMWMWVRFKKARGKSIAESGIASVLGPVPLAVKLDLDGVLLLPQLRIEFRTAPLLLNLMAFEQSAEQHAGDISAYVWLMAKLVQSAEDAGVLVAAEVVQSSMAGSGSNEYVVRFFREVGAASEAPGMLEQSYLADMLEGLRNRTWYPLLTKRADVQRYYVNVPWRLVAAFVTVVTTVASILQTYASFKQKP